MFSKTEFFTAVTVSLIAGIGIGYSKAREIFIGALINVSAPKCEIQKEEESN
ncbi:hypothetical protein [Bacteroides sp.]|uniref:hypothetical protein n=1 Tax=Bacteroides sp. TaxID=29523 RepID=UPI00261AB29C|nr:hypothetical protein [Bacteroides sp.]MDD3040031.1 hypothetical protein [Bacteroides sp.]